jgi:hypothetical protein
LTLFVNTIRYRHAPFRILLRATTALLSISEPLAVNAPILSDELHRSGIMRKILEQLPWYKKTRHIEVMLAGHLAGRHYSFRI